MKKYTALFAVILLAPSYVVATHDPFTTPPRVRRALTAPPPVRPTGVTEPEAHPVFAFFISYTAESPITISESPSNDDCLRATAMLQLMNCHPDFVARYSDIIKSLTFIAEKILLTRQAAPAVQGAFQAIQQAYIIWYQENQ